MQIIIYRLVYPIIWILSKLPWRIFYTVSDIVFVFVYYIIGYRKKTVTDNLTLVFPEKSIKEIKRIRKASFRHMTDMFLEMTRTLSISEEEMIQRFHVTNPEKLKEIEDKK